jgi:hypothetical protein
MKKIKFLFADRWFLVLLLNSLFSVFMGIFDLKIGYDIGAKIAIIFTIPVTVMALGFQLNHLLFYYDLLQLKGDKNQDGIIFKVKK